jgi:hypothetical protein
MLHKIIMPAHANYTEASCRRNVYVNVTKDYLACSCSKSQRSEELDNVNVRQDDKIILPAHVNNTEASCWRIVYVNVR